MQEKAPQVFKNAVNRTAKEARAKLTSGAQAAYSVKTGGFNSRMKIQNATAGNLTAIIRSQDRPLTVTRFTHRGNKKGKGGSAASADITKSGLKSIISSRSGKAFKVNGLVMQRTSSSRLPVKVLRSNSVPKMLEKVYQGERGIEGALEQPINEALRRHIEAEVAKLI